MDAVWPYNMPMKNNLESPILEESNRVMLSQGEAVTMIAEIKQRIHAMGANDTEFFDIGLIENKLREGEIEPNEAVHVCADTDAVG